MTSPEAITPRVCRDSVCSHLFKEKPVTNRQLRKNGLTGLVDGIIGGTSDTGRMNISTDHERLQEPNGDMIMQHTVESAINTITDIVHERRGSSGCGQRDIAMAVPLTACNLLLVTCTYLN